jgi:hypothetical protein
MWAKSTLKGKVKEFWWRKKQDKLKIKRVDSHRIECRRCGVKLDSIHLTGECRKKETIQWCKQKRIKVDEVGWDEEIVEG